METQLAEVPTAPAERPSELTTDLGHLKAIKDYYEQAGPDYRAWSDRYNMHFGYWRRGINPLNLEAMLEEMNSQIGHRLELDDAEAPQIADLGCGLGTTARSMARRFGRGRVYGITISPWQVAQGTELNQAAGLQGRVQLLVGDYTVMPFADSSLNGAYAIESACYAPGNDKWPLLQEAARVLKPGAKLVVADGFFRHARQPIALMRRVYKRLGECWVVREFALLPAFRQALVRAGFTDIRVEDASWRVAPSVAHVPWTVVKFLTKEVWQAGSLKLGRHRTNNFIGPLLGMVAGMDRGRFGYFIITATKADGPRYVF